MSKPMLPKPNIPYPPKESDALDENSLKGLICNPIYTGLSSHPQTLSDEAWIQAATQMIEEEGAEQFLVNMLYLLRQSLNEPSNNVATIKPKNPPLYCYHDDFPMIEIHGVFVCAAEYIFEHLENSPVTDLITRPPLSLVFQNGHTLPLLAHETGEPLQQEDEDELLENLTGLSLVDAEWDDEYQAIILYFGDFASLTQTETDSEPSFLSSVCIHIDSIRQMTCPHLTKADLDNEDFIS